MRHVKQITTLQGDKIWDGLEAGLWDAELALAIEQVCENSEFQLLESLAAKIISQLFTYPSIDNASVSITKPNIIPNADAVTVSLYREAP